MGKAKTFQSDFAKVASISRTVMCCIQARSSKTCLPVLYNWVVLLNGISFQGTKKWQMKSFQVKLQCTGTWCSPNEKKHYYHKRMAKKVANFSLSLSSLLRGSLKEELQHPFKIEMLLKVIPSRSITTLVFCNDGNGSTRNIWFVLRKVNTFQPSEWEWTPS